MVDFSCCSMIALPSEFENSLLCHPLGKMFLSRDTRADNPFQGNESVLVKDL